MTAFGIVYIILGVIFIIGCALDSPEVRPRRDMVVGGLVYRMAEHFWPDYFKFEDIELTLVHFGSVRLNSQKVISYQQMQEIMMTPYLDDDILVGRARAEIARDLHNMIVSDKLINYVVDTESMAPNILVKGYLDVGVRNEY